MNIAVDQWPKDHLINVDEYYRMVQAGMLAPDARVELFEGKVIDRAPIGSRHAGTVNKLSRLFSRVIGEQAVLSLQSPVRLSDRSEPQPDISLLKPRADYYGKSHPTPADVLLLIEVSDTTLQFDRGQKLALYAKHSIPEVWVVDLENNQLHCMREPDSETGGGSYRSTISLHPSQNVAVAALPDVRIELAALFE